MIGLIGKKLGMTRTFQEDGRVVPVTVIQAGPCVVTQVKNEATDGYSAVQIGFGHKKPKNTPMPMQGHFRKAGTTSHWGARSPSWSPIRPNGEYHTSSASNGTTHSAWWLSRARRASAVIFSDWK